MLDRRLTALLTALTFAAPVAAQENEKKKDPMVGEDGVRRDPQGVKGISPFWESVKKGDNAYVARDFDGAIAAYKEALGHEPQRALGHYRLGEAQLAKGEKKEAQASWETAKRFVGQDHALKAKILFVLADLEERKRSLKAAVNGWNAYEAHSKAQPSAKTYPETPPERKKRIAEWEKLEEQYASVKKRIAKRLAEVEADAKSGKK